MVMPHILCLKSSCELLQFPRVSNLYVRYEFYFKFEDCLYKHIRMEKKMERSGEQAFAVLLATYLRGFLCEEKYVKENRKCKELRKNEI